MNLHKLLVICITTFIVASCGRQQPSGVDNANTTTVVSVATSRHVEHRHSAAPHASGDLVRLADAAEEDSVASNVAHLVQALSETGDGTHLADEDMSFLEQDWRMLTDPQERAIWAGKAMGTRGGVEKAKEAFASLTNSPDLYWRIRAYCSLATLAGRERDLLTVQSLLAECERQLGLEPNMSPDGLAYEALVRLDQIWELRAALARTIHESRSDGQYSEDIDARQESFWHALRLKYFPYENNKKAMICAELAFALVREGKPNEAKRRLGEALTMLSLENHKNSVSEKMARDYQKIYDNWDAGGNASVSKTYW